MDPVAVEQTLNVWSQKSFVKMHGIHQVNESRATAYFVLKMKGKETDAYATILYFLEKGWFITRIDYGYDIERGWWHGVFEKIERKK